MKKYVIKRNEVMAGTLTMVLPVRIENMSENINSKFLDYEGFASINVRGMLFKFNEKLNAKDLIYTTPTTYNVEYINVKDKLNFVITNLLELDKLLKYLGFNDSLTKDDVDKVFNMLIKHKSWLNRNSKLFGITRNLLGEYSYDKDNATFSGEMYKKLDIIQCAGYKPNEDEPGYSLIKKIK